jgi:hypothetical protein
MDIDFSWRKTSRTLGNRAEGRCILIMPALPKSFSKVCPGSTNFRKAAVLPSGPIGPIERNMGPAILVALRTAIGKDVVFFNFGGHGT